MGGFAGVLVVQICGAMIRVTIFMLRNPHVVSFYRTIHARNAPPPLYLYLFSVNKFRLHDT